LPVFRRGDGKRRAARFDIADMRTGDADDPQRQAGNVVVAGTIEKGLGDILKFMPLARFAVL
jgi:hypothetical protein